MITTREINVDLSKGRKLNRVTTKDIDASPKVKLLKKSAKAQGISTSNIADVADIREKKRRDDIAEEKKLAMKDEKKIILNVDNEGDSMVVEKKPWNKMNAKERKEYQAEKAKKVKEKEDKE